MMRRDYRLTGTKRGQAVRTIYSSQRDAIAPEQFATNSAWSAERV